MLIYHHNLATYGFVAAAITFYFMKDLLAELVKSVFTHIINPRVWSRIYADTNRPSPTPSPAPQDHRNYIQTISNHPHTTDIRLLEVDLSNNKFKLTFANSSAVDVLAAGVETLSLNDGSSGTPVSPLSSIEPANTSDEADHSDISDRKPAQQKQNKEINVCVKRNEIADIVQLPSYFEECQLIDHISLSSEALTESLISLEETSESTTLSTESSIAESGNATSSESSSQRSSLGSDIEIIS